jgi:hypothetical protein
MGGEAALWDAAVPQARSGTRASRRGKSADLHPNPEVESSPLVGRATVAVEAIRLRDRGQWQAEGPPVVMADDRLQEAGSG